MSMRRIMAGAAGGLVIALGAGHMTTLQAQEEAASRSADQRFITSVAAENLLEVRLAQQAQTRAADSSVRVFAQRMVVNHTTMQKEWMEVASENDLELRARLSPQHVQQLERLKTVPVAEFDRVYMGQMVQNHRANVSAFQNERSVAHSAGVRQLIDRGVPALQEHLRLAELIGRRVGAVVPGDVATGTDTFPATPTTTDTSVTRTIPPWADTSTVATRDPRQGQTDRQRNAERQNRRNGSITADAEFIRDVDAGHFLEIRLGRLAQDKARDPAVKRFGERMEEDHSTLIKQWSDMASRNGMKRKSGMGPLHRVKLTRLEKISGKEFDKAYMKLMIQNHQDYLNYWRKDGRAAETAPVRQLVNRGIPTLEEHMDMAKRIGRQVGVDPDEALQGRRISRSDRPTVIR